MVEGPWEGGGFPFWEQLFPGTPGKAQGQPCAQGDGEMGQSPPAGSLLAAGSANSTSSRGRRGACQQQTLRRVESPPPSWAGRFGRPPCWPGTQAPPCRGS